MNFKVGDVVRYERTVMLDEQAHSGVALTFERNAVLKEFMGAEYTTQIVQCDIVMYVYDLRCETRHIIQKDVVIVLVQDGETRKEGPFFHPLEKRVFVEAGHDCVTGLVRGGEAGFGGRDV